MLDPHESPEISRDRAGRFLAGNGGGGRQKGSRNKLSEAFVTDLFDDWQVHGRDTIRKVREEKPEIYLRVAASLIPREFKVEAEVVADAPVVSDRRLAMAILHIIQQADVPDVLDQLLATKAIAPPT